MKRTLSFILSLIMIISTFAGLAGVSAGASGKTGIGLAEWAMRAYNEGWKYVYAGASVGKVDCSGLVYSYAGGYHGAKKMTEDYASKKGSVSSGIPRIHGLVLYAAPSKSSSTPHMGVYVGKDENGNDMAVDARSSSQGVVYKTVASRVSKPWVTWFKHSKLSYPTTGWYTYKGKKFYYKDGQFVTGKYKVDGVTYDFGKSGALKGTISGDDSSSSTDTTTKTTTTTKAASEALKYGSKGEAVTKLQKRLIELGFLSGTADGSYGNKTVEAVKSFQKQIGIKADGMAGPETQKKLYASDAPKATTTTTTTTKKTTTTTTTKKTTTTTTTKKTTTTTPKKTTTTTPKKTTTTTTTAKKTTTTSTTKKTTTTTTAKTSKYTTLKVGDKGDPVYQLQYRLKMLGYLNTKYDGTYGNITAAAVKQFQKKAGLPVDGVATVETQEKLYSTKAPWASEGEGVSSTENNLDAQASGTTENTSTTNTFVVLR
ncbi:MAG: peptidoglycan-binding protein [Clostridia bacterium]|nr:peptidoglycan-binding protein [Clostridia bacterium]